ncbi:MAG: hypothetical protein JW873_02625 [Candidatus Saganbacteria bacterium]|nr:hypothetical protein [Candidatus Saganbacteria bacterium]
MGLSAILAGAKIRLYKSRANEGASFKGKVLKPENFYMLDVKSRERESRIDLSKTSDFSWKLAHLVAQAPNTMRAGFLLHPGAFSFAEHIIALEKFLPPEKSVEIGGPPLQKLVLEGEGINPFKVSQRRHSISEYLLGKPVESAVELYAYALQRVLFVSGTAANYEKCFLKLKLDIWKTEITVWNGILD